MIHVGDVLDGKYEALSPIGRGGMSRVWLARDLRLNKLWALKEVRRTEAGGDPLAEGSLLGEARLLRDLDHPALPRVVDVLEEPDAIVVVMDYVEGESLDRVLARRGGRLREDEVVSIGLRLCEVLGYLHSRVPPIVYRDMKPANVMLTPTGEVRLVDLGIARTRRADAGPDTLLLGTRGYAAPEQFGRTCQTDARTDVYGLGMTLYQLATGADPSEEPFEVRPLGTFDPTLSEGLDRVIRRATQTDPARRYQSCENMREDLAHHHELTAAFRGRQARRLRRFRVLSAVAVLLLVVGVGCLVARERIIGSTFEHYLTMAQASPTTSQGEAPSEAEEALLAAADVRPRSIEPYDLLVNQVYKADGEFSVAEEGRWRTLFWSRRDELSRQEGYARLCRDVGMLYLVYYRYGDEETRGAEAATWFGYAARAYEQRAERRRPCSLDGRGYRSVLALETVGGFCRELSRARAEGTEGETYGSCWHALGEAVASLDAGDSPVVCLRVCQLAFRAIVSPEYLAGFARAGVSGEEAASLLDGVEEKASSLAVEASRDTLAQSLYEEVVQGRAQAEQNVRDVYAGREAA